ncbi:hypothetical protein DV515_00012389, partial [Chloebia gouldiae]
MLQAPADEPEESCGKVKASREAACFPGVTAARCRQPSLLRPVSPPGPQAGVVGCLRARGCHYGRPRQPPLQNRLVPTNHPARAGAAPGREHGGLPRPGTHSRSVDMENSWKRGSSRPQLPVPVACFALFVIGIAIV